MTSESGVERDVDPTPGLSIEERLERVSGQVAELIKERDDFRDRAALLERTVMQQTSLLAVSEVEKLEARLELAKNRAHLARKLAREAGSKPIAIYALELGGKANGKDA